MKTTKALTKSLINFRIWNIEKIPHKGIFLKETSMKFLVKYENYDNPSDNRWLSWKDLRSNANLHKYLIERNKKNLIPK